MILFVYALCVITSVFCAVLLLRGYRLSRARLLFWAALCFLGLAINSIMVFVDETVVTWVDLTFWRALPALAGVCAFIYGLVWEGR
jgi:hypothetical protein